MGIAPQSLGFLENKSRVRARLPNEWGIVKPYPYLNLCRSSLQDDRSSTRKQGSTLARPTFYTVCTCTHLTQTAHSTTGYPKRELLISDQIAIAFENVLTSLAFGRDQLMRYTRT